jgi:NADH-quinone oxidoreductase subunit H
MRLTTSFFGSVFSVQVLLFTLLILISLLSLKLTEKKCLEVLKKNQKLDFFDLLQLLTDSHKMLKTSFLTGVTNFREFVLFTSTTISFLASFFGWWSIPFTESLKYSYLGVDLIFLYILNVFSLGIYGVVMCTCFDRFESSKIFLKLCIEMIFYQLSFGFSFLAVTVCSNSINLNDIVEAQRYVWYCTPLSIPCFIFFFTSIVLAEGIRRQVSDITEKKHSYSAIILFLFSLAEYSNILFICSLNSVLFFGGWQPPLEFLSFIPGVFWISLKTLLLFVLFLYARIILPEYTENQLKYIDWKFLLPLSFGYYLFVLLIMYIIRN